MLTRYDDKLGSHDVNRHRPYFPGDYGPSTFVPVPTKPLATSKPPPASPASESVVLKKLGPGAPGARRLTERFGPALVCVRYREDAAGGRRLTTVELIVDQRPLPGGEQWVKIDYDETELRARVKEAGGQWDARRKLWRLPKAVVRRLKLAARVVPENA